MFFKKKEDRVFCDCCQYVGIDSKCPIMEETMDYFGNLCTTCKSRLQNWFPREDYWTLKECMKTMPENRQGILNCFNEFLDKQYNLYGCITVDSGLNITHNIMDDLYTTKDGQYSYTLDCLVYRNMDKAYYDALNKKAYEKVTKDKPEGSDISFKDFLNARLHIAYSSIKSTFENIQ